MGKYGLLKTTDPEVCVSGRSEDKHISVPSLNLTPYSNRFYITLFSKNLWREPLKFNKVMLILRRFKALV